MWQKDAFINIGKDYNFFYKQCVNFESKFLKYENQSNVPWQNVYHYIRENNRITYDSACMLLENADKIISEYQLLLRENTYEEVRAKCYSHLPSRTKSIWLCRENQVQFWKKELGNHKYKIFIVEVFGNTFKSNNSMISLPSSSYSKIKEEAKKYWEYDNYDEKEDDEYLYVGRIKVIKDVTDLW